MSLRNSSAMIFNTFKQRRFHLRRNLSLGSLCLGWICIGLTLGWPESTLTYFLESYCNSTCYPLLEDEAATIQIVMNCGSCIGALVPSWIADTYGRKSSFAVAGILNFIFWACLMGTQSNLTILIVAAVGGIAAGTYTTTAAIYVSEISLPRARGANNAITAVCAYFGALLASSLLFITLSRIVALIMICLATLYLASLHWWLVESPYYLFLQGQTLNAKLSLKTLRGARTVVEIDPEYKTIEFFFCMTRNNRTKGKGSMSSRRRRCAILVIMVLCVTQMVGAYGMEDYSRTLMDNVMPQYRRVAISFLDVASVAICLWLIENIGKKRVLFAISVVGSGITCLILAIYILSNHYTDLSTTDYQNSSIAFPATILTFYYMIYSLGLTPILPIITGEIFPSRYKTAGLCMCISFIYFSSMIIQFTFESLDAKQGKSLAFVYFAIFGSLGIPFLFVYLPETHGKALHEIQDEFDDYGIIMP